MKSKKITSKDFFSFMKSKKSPQRIFYSFMNSKNITPKQLEQRSFPIGIRNYLLWSFILIFIHSLVFPFCSLSLSFYNLVFYLSVFLSTYISIYLSLHQSVFASVYLCMCISMFVSVHICISSGQSVRLPVHL